MVQHHLARSFLYFLWGCWRVFWQPGSPKLATVRCCEQSGNWLASNIPEHHVLTPLTDSDANATYEKTSS
jgi:hypothetical protein